MAHLPPSTMPTNETANGTGVDVAATFREKPLRAAPRPNDAGVILVLVGLPWLLPASEWFMMGGTPAPLTGNISIFKFEPWKSISPNFAWRDLQEFGADLADWLLGLCKSPAAASKRIVLVGHSLAGIIVKHCWILLNGGLRHESSLVKESLAGIVFMGTPHCPSAARRDVLYKQSTYILQLGGYTRRRGDGLDTGSDLTAVSVKFEELSNNVEIVSIHEMRPTKMPGRMRSPSLVIVDKRLATIDSELLTGIASGHKDIPRLKDNNPPLHLDEHAQKLIQQLLDRATESSLRSQTSIPRDIPLRQSTNTSTLSSASSVPSAESLPRIGEPEQDVLLEPLIEEFRTPRPFPKLPCSMLDITRQHNDSFYGREEPLRLLELQLHRESHVAVVHGTGGVGKSEVAMEFVHLFKHAFEAVFWIPSDDIAKMRQIVGRIAVKLGLENEEHPTDPHTSREIAKAWLADPKKASPDTSKADCKARWLLIFDGAKDANTMKEFSPIFGHGSVLITTQDPDLANGLPCNPDIVRSVHLELFDQDNASHMLVQLAKKDGMDSKAEHKAATEIIARSGCGGWPLVISQTAMMIRNKYNLSLSEFRQFYSDESDDDYRHVEAASCEIMASAINLARLSAHANAVLQVCSNLDPDSIEEFLFLTSFNLDTLPEGFPKDALQFADARAELLRSSLIHRNEEKSEFWMHHMVQETVRRKSSAKTFNDAFQSAAYFIALAWKSPGRQARDSLRLWEPCAKYLHHIFHLQHIYERIPNGEYGSGSTMIQASDSFARLLSEAACYHTKLGSTAGLKKTLDIALAVCGGLPERQTFDLGSDIYHGLGAWANETNHPQECYNYNKLYLDKRLDAVKGGADPDERTAAAWNQYGTGLMVVGRREDAMEAFQTSIDLYASVFPHDKECSDSLPIVNLAVATWMGGDNDRAFHLLEGGLTARQDVFGIDDTDSFRTGRFLHAIGNVRWDQQNYKVSKSYHKRALKQYMETLGNFHHRTADVCHRMAMHCLRDKELREAGQFIDQALESWRLDPESFQQEIARTTWLMARHRAMSGNPTEAKELREEAAGARNRLCPNDLKSIEELTDQDFDELVAFWSR